MSLSNVVMACGFGDFGCQVNEQVNTTITDFAGFLASWMGGLIKGALNADSQVVIFDGQGHGVFGNAGFSSQFGFWLWVMMSVVVIVAIVQAGIAMIAGNGRRLLHVGLSVLLAVPTTYLSLLVFEQTNKLMNLVSDSLIDKVIADGDGGLPKALMNMTGLGTYIVPDSASSDPWAIVKSASLNTAGGVFASGQTPPLGMVLVIGVLLIAAMFLAVAMLVRVFGLAVLAVIAPIGIMFIGQPKLKVWAVRWVEVVVGLLLAKPLATALIGVSVAIGAGQPADTVSDGTATTGFFGVLAAFVGLTLAAASPAVTIGLTRFASAELQQSVARRPSFTSAANKVSVARNTAGSLGRLFGVGRPGRAGIAGAAGAVGSPARNGRPGRPATSQRTRGGSGRPAQGSFYSRQRDRTRSQRDRRKK